MDGKYTIYVGKYTVGPMDPSWARNGSIASNHEGTKPSPQPFSLSAVSKEIRPLKPHGGCTSFTRGTNHDDMLAITKMALFIGSLNNRISGELCST